MTKENGQKIGMVLKCIGGKYFLTNIKRYDIIQSQKIKENEDMTTTQTIELNREEIYDDEDKSCNNCKHHLKFMCKNWRTCHDYSDWELEELDFVQPKKKIPCTIKVQADGEYISRKALLEDLYKRDYTKFTHRDFVALVQYQDIVAIPNKTETGHWIDGGEYICFGGRQKAPCICSVCRKSALNEPWYYCPNCGCRMVEEQERSEE